MVPGTKTAMLRLEQFSTGAAPKVRSALQEIKAAGADRLIFDLRGNPGGYVNEAVAIASEFLASGNVYIERNAAGEEKPTAVTPGGVATDIPLVVLIDKGSASAAEIVAGAIQDAGRAQARRGADVRDRDGPRRIRAVGRIGAPDRNRRVADAQGPGHLARGDRSRRRRRAPGRCRADGPRGPALDVGRRCRAIADPQLKKAIELAAAAS